MNLTQVDKDWIYTGAFICALGVLWYFATKNAGSEPLTAVQASGALPIPWATPMDDVYDSSASAPANAYAPPSAASLTVNVNVPDQLSNSYMPLFGFVGVAEGELYQ
jgi:hypothetical protein